METETSPQEDLWMKVKFFRREQFGLPSILSLQGQLFLPFRNSGEYDCFMNGFYEELVFVTVL